MLSLGQTPLPALTHRSSSDFPGRLRWVWPNPFGEAAGFCLPCWVYKFLLVSACFLLVSLCLLLGSPLAIVPQVCPCPSVGCQQSLRGVPLYGRESHQPRTPPPPPATSSSASPAPRLQEHHLSLKAAACFLKYV